MNLPPIAEFVQLVKVTDEDADHRLPLVEQAANILYSAVTISNDEREMLAEKFERWRYQRLNKYGVALSANDRHLIALLDLATSKILQGQTQPPKSPRAAIYSAAGLADKRSQSTGLPAFEAALNRDIPLAEITRKAAAITLSHFRPRATDAIANEDQNADQSTARWRMRLYAPVYLSNYCVNHCLYCAFRFPNKMDRVHLGVDEVVAEAEVLRRQGHEHLLIVAGDFPKLTSTEYLVQIIRELVERKFSVAVEVAPQGTVSYRKMVRAGAFGVTLYQETYDEDCYNRVHPRGPKLWFDWRLEGPERAAAAGMKKLGLGILLGLTDPMFDIRRLIRHGQYLLDRFPEVKLAFSLPRIHEAPEGFESEFTIDDETFIRLYCALRFSFPAADLVLSTRESPSLRDLLANICITQMSAGSCTAPGGYTERNDGAHPGQQFPVFDHRSTVEVAHALEKSGFALSWDASEDQN